jgi:hypothetical protein
VSGNRILAFIVTGLLVVMCGVLLYAAFDIHDTQPFGVDPEVPFFMLCSMLMLCIGTVSLTARLLGLRLSLAELILFGLWAALRCLTGLREARPFERLLLSPALTVTSLRI